MKKGFERFIFVSIILLLIVVLIVTLNNGKNNYKEIREKYHTILDEYNKFLLYNIYNSDESKNEPYETKIIFDYDISIENKKCINKIVGDIKPSLLLKVKSIYFTNNQSKLPLNANGMNKDNEITILIENWEIGMRELICHEILHSWIDGDEYEEEIVNYLDYEFGCFFLSNYDMIDEMDCMEVK